MTLVDTNVLLDLITDDRDWFDWSVSQLDMAAMRGPIVINDVIYAELSVHYARIDHLDKMITDAGLTLANIPRAALFLAGKAYARYRSQRGLRTGVLADFFIGAHAAINGMTLLTRDPRRYRTYFPNVELIAPNIELK